MHTWLKDANVPTDKVVHRQVAHARSYITYMYYFFVETECPAKVSFCLDMCIATRLEKNGRCQAL